MTLQRRHKRCIQLSMVDIFRFHSAFHLSLHLQDHLRFNMDSFDDTPEVDLDALLEDLCSMERDMKGNTLERKNSVDSAFQSITNLDVDDNRKSISPALVTKDVKDRLENLQTELEANELSPEEQEKKIKAEKMRIALEKMKAASFQKLFIKVYGDDVKTSKTMLIDQTWTARDVKQKMIQKDDKEPDPNWCIIEKLPEMFMERILEDHEFLLQTVQDWGRGNENNMLVFLKRRDKNIMFRNPQNFLLDEFSSSEATKLAEKSKDILLNEFFQKDNTRIPPVEGVLWLKAGAKKWNKHYFALRASGIYYSPKGKQKTRELQCLCQFEHNSVYLGVGFKKHFKAPTDHVFCLKHPKIQTMKSKHIVCLCAEDNRALHQWITGIRMARFGYNLYEDYLQTQEELESALLGGSMTTLSSATSGIASSITSTNASSSSSLNSQSHVGTLSRKKQTALKTNPDGTPYRMKGRQDKLKELFTSAWTKGIEESEVGSSDMIFSPMSPDPALLLSPKAEPVTFDFSNRAMTLNSRNELYAKVNKPTPKANAAFLNGHASNDNNTSRYSSDQSTPSSLYESTDEYITSNASSTTSLNQPPSHTPSSKTSPPQPPPPPPPPVAAVPPPPPVIQGAVPPPPPPISKPSNVPPPPPPFKPVGIKPEITSPPPNLEMNKSTDSSSSLPPPPDDFDEGFDDSNSSLPPPPPPPPPADLLPPPPPPLDAKPSRRKSSPPPPPRRTSSICN